MRQAAAVFALLIATATSAADDPNRFENVTAGLALTKPTTWNFMSLQKVTENRAAIKMQSEEFERAVRELATAPLVVVAKHPEPYPSLNPTFQVILRPLPASMAEMSAVDVLGAVVPTLRQNFSDFALEQDVRETKVAGHAAADFIARYTVKTRDGGAFPTRSRMIVIPRSGFLLILGMSGPPEGPDEATADFDFILSSLSIAEQR